MGFYKTWLGLIAALPGDKQIKLVRRFLVEEMEFNMEILTGGAICTMTEASDKTEVTKADNRVTSIGGIAAYNTRTW